MYPCIQVAGKGWGVFAEESINQGDFVIEYVGEYVSPAEAERRSALSPLAGDYMMELPGRGGGSGGGGSGGSGGSGGGGGDVVQYAHGAVLCRAAGATAR